MVLDTFRMYFCFMTTSIFYHSFILYSVPEPIFIKQLLKKG